jgi:subtilase family serine protease
MSSGLASGLRAALMLLVAAIGVATAVHAQTPPRQVTERIDDARTVTREGNTRPEANAVNDRGIVDATYRMDHMQLLLRRSAESEAAVQSRIAALYDPASPDFHQWLTAEEFGRQYGPAPEDIAAVTGWLDGHGFVVNGVQPSGMVIDFSGNAGQVQAAFHTEIHNLEVDGVHHIANVSDPQIPAALAGVVEGVASLTDFRPHPQVRTRPNYTIGTGKAATYGVVPADLATIYNFNPLFKAGMSGQKQTVVVIEDTDVFNAADWSTFRSKFGLAAYGEGTFTQVHPTGSSGCAAPGVVSGYESEAALDAEWASAAAPSAAIVLASCADAGTTFGGTIALLNLLNSAKPPAIISISFGQCETENGVTGNAAAKAIYQQAVALGTSIFVAAGDEGAAGCDFNASVATHGIGVNGLASTPYNVAVGGTDFADTYANASSIYWSTTNGPTDGSALSYIPEIPWNDSCASVLLATSHGYSTPYGPTGFCNSSPGKAAFLTDAAGGGGPSGCTTGNPRIPSVVSGTCKGNAKPKWQVVLGNPNDHVRDLPDVSLFAADGTWGHFYVYCDSDVNDGGVPCTGAPSNWSAAGGTSFAAPIMAGIQALVNQKQGARQGLPTPVYYKLAAAEYGTAGNPGCNPSIGKVAGSTCIFYNITLGDMTVNCTGPYDCYHPGGGNGVLSTTDKSDAKAYGTGIGWNFATGLGSVNVTNLVNHW